MCFYDNYAALCKAMGKTPSAVATELKLAKSAVTKWKNGTVKIPNGKTISLLCEYFGVSSDALLGIKKEAPTISGEGSSEFEKFNLLDEADKSYILGQIDALLSKRK